MKIGTVFIWKNYTHLINEEKKDIYCVYFGDSGPLVDPEFIIFHKLTGQTHYYENGGERQHKKHYRFTKIEYQKLKKDSIFDFEFPEETIYKTDFEKADKEELFILKEDKIRMLYNHIKETYCRYTHQIKLRIHDNLNNDGITGLPQPKRKHRT